MFANIFEEFGSFYFIGIGGVSMSALAKYVNSLGKKVGGCDDNIGDFAEELIAMGIPVTDGGSEDFSAYDVVIYTDAIDVGDKRLVRARSLNKIIIPRGRFLYEVSKNFGTVIAVSGCHGKTTCTSMLAHIFSAAGKSFCAHIGGRDLDFGNFYMNGGDYFITEACEYKKNFLLLKPDIAVALSCRPDHLECYGSAENLKQCYSAFLNTAGVGINLYGDAEFDGLTFGFDKNADYHAADISEDGGAYSFDIYEGCAKLGSAELSVVGKHNILNALAATAVARSAGIPFRYIREGLNSFRGVERRFELLGEVNGVRWFADYAHHPDEIKAAVRTATKVAEGKIFVVFQPHTYSRTKLLFKHFVRILSQQQNLLIYKTYAAREYYDDAGSALTLSKKLKKSHYGDTAWDINEFVKKAKEGDLVLFLGAGDIYDIAKSLVKNSTQCP